MKIPKLPLDSITLDTTPWVYDSKPFEWNSPPLDHYILSIGIEGEVTLLKDEKPYTQKPWRAFVLPPGTHNRAERQEMLVNFSAHFSINRPAKKNALPFIVADVIEIGLCQSLIEGCMQIALDDEPLSNQQKQFFVLQLLTLVWRAHKKPKELQPRDRKIYEQVSRFRSGKDLFKSTRELAEEAHMSRVHYSNCFRALFNQSPNSYLIERRIDKACILLRTTSDTLETISETIGYSDVHFFIRQFQSVKQMTPSQFRRG